MAAQDGCARACELPALPKSALPGMVRNGALICRLLLQAVLEKLRVLSLCFQLHFLLCVQLRLGGLSRVGRVPQMRLGHVLKNKVSG